MLGLRHYRNTAVDLWQGEAADFVCDGRFVLDGADFGGQLATVLEQFPRGHVTLTTLGSPAEMTEEGASKLMQHLKSFLDAQSPGAMRRLTFVLHTLPLYKVFQEQLFATFPEPDEGTK